MIVSETSASTVTVRFFPGTGGSGDTAIDLIWLRESVPNGPHGRIWREEGQGLRVRDDWNIHYIRW